MPANDVSQGTASLAGPWLQGLSKMMPSWCVTLAFCSPSSSSELRSWSGMLFTNGGMVLQVHLRSTDLQRTAQKMRLLLYNFLVGPMVALIGPTPWMTSSMRGLTSSTRCWQRRMTLRPNFLHRRRRLLPAQTPRLAGLVACAIIQLTAHRWTSIETFLYLLFRMTLSQKEGLGYLGIMEGLDTSLYFLDCWSWQNDVTSFLLDSKVLILSYLS